MRCVSAGPRNVTAPGTAGRGCAPEAIRSAPYSIVSDVVRACLRTASTLTSAPGVNVAPASSARRARSKCCASPSPNGSATDIGRYQNCGSGASSSTFTNSPASARSASAASSAATPPPAIRTLVVSPRIAPPSVDDQDVTVGLALDAAADAEPEQAGEDARLTGSDDDQVGVTHLGDADDLMCRLAQPGDVLAVEAVLGQDGGRMAKLLVVLLERVDWVDRPEAVSGRHKGSRDARDDELAAECRGQLDRTGERSLRGLALVVSDHDGVHRWPPCRMSPGWSPRRRVRPTAKTALRSAAFYGFTGATRTAAGTRSPATIQAIAPAANPSPAARSGSNQATKRKAGTAINGCGRLENTLQPAALPTEIPRGTSTRLIASPSGMLWTAIARAITSPSSSPPPNATPTPTPSVNEWIVITPTISTIEIASAPPIEPKWRPRSRLRRRLVTAMKSAPAARPSSTRPAPRCHPSHTSPTLAPAMAPAASAFATPSDDSLGWDSRRNGSAPRPVASAVASAARKTAPMLKRPSARRGRRRCRAWR